MRHSPSPPVFHVPLLGATMCLLVYLVGGGCDRSSATVTWPLNEALAGWEKFDRHFWTCRGKWFLTRKDEGHVFVSEIEYQRNGTNKLILRRLLSGGDKQERVIGVNQGYAFLLHRGAQSHWSVESLGDINDDVFLRALADSAVTLESPINVKREALAVAIKKPYFRISDVRTIENSGQRFVEIDFRYEHAYYSSDRNPFNWVQGGTLTLWPGNCWVIKRALYEMQEGGGRDNQKFIAEIEFDYDGSEAGEIRFPVARRETYRNYASSFDAARQQPITVEMTTRYEMEAVAATSLPNSEFSLVRFGLGEVEPLVSRSRGPWIPIVVGLIGLIVIVFYLKKRRAGYSD